LTESLWIHDRNAVKMRPLSFQKAEISLSLALEQFRLLSLLISRRSSPWTRVSKLSDDFSDQSMSTFPPCSRRFQITSRILVSWFNEEFTVWISQIHQFSSDRSCCLSRWEKTHWILFDVITSFRSFACLFYSMVEIPISHFWSDNRRDDLVVSFRPWKFESSHFGLYFMVVVCIILCEDPGARVDAMRPCWSSLDHRHLKVQGFTIIFNKCD
jgi:hypothetical protein